MTSKFRTVRAWFRFALAASLAAPGAARAGAIFSDGFASERTCSWSYVGETDACPLPRLYASTGTDLFLIDLSSFEAVLVGAFATGGPSITDIAVDKDDNIYAISGAKLWSVNPSNGFATQLADFDTSTDGQRSLSFVPLDDADPTSVERLVTAGDSGNVYEVNRATGAQMLLGNFGLSGGNQIRAAGDLVSIRGLGTFATVTIGDTPTDQDYLASINTATWAATPIGATSTGFDHLAGLAFWNGVFYGFVDNGSGNGGAIITIDPATGVGTLADSDLYRWFGAGVDTRAPLGN